MAQRERDLLHWQGVSPAKLKNNKLFFPWRAFPLRSWRLCEKQGGVHPDFSGKK